MCVRCVFEIHTRCVCDVMLLIDFIGKELKNYKSLLCWFLMQKKNSKISGFKNHLWNGITTRHFAKIISILIEKNIKIPNVTPSKNPQNNTNNPF